MPCLLLPCSSAPPAVASASGYGSLEWSPATNSASCLRILSMRRRRLHSQTPAKTRITISPPPMPTHSPTTSFFQSGHLSSLLLRSAAASCCRLVLAAAAACCCVTSVAPSSRTAGLSGTPFASRAAYMPAPLSAAASCKPLAAAAGSAAAREYDTETPLLLLLPAAAAACSSRRLLPLPLLEVLLAGLVPALLTVDLMLLAGTPDTSDTACRLP